VSVCLDAWAVLAWLDGDQPALSRIEELLDERPLLSWINLVEVYYRVVAQRDVDGSATLGLLWAQRDDRLVGVLPACRVVSHDHSPRTQQMVVCQQLPAGR
jgi:hypothetical protein